MKSNIIKYVFSVIVICLIIYAAYAIYGKKDNLNNQIIHEETISKDIITNIKIPVTEFDTVNPILSKNKNVQDIVKLVYESLLDIDENYKIKLCLASEWSKVSATSYLIKLKENIKWQDGTKFTARDVQFTIDKLKDSKVSSIYSYNVQYVNSVEVIDDNTIRINLSQEVPYFEYNLTFPIMSQKSFKNQDFTNLQINTTPTGTGKFKVISNDESKIVLEKNQSWWNLPNVEVKLTQINVLKYANMGEVYNAFKIENIDLLNTESINVEDYIGTLGYASKDYHSRELDFIAFNCENNILSNKEVRQAISYGIDKQNIVSSIYRNKYYISNFPLDMGNYLYENEKVSYEYNLDKVKQILQSNGWEYKSKVWQKTKEYKTQKIRLNLVVKSSNEKRVEVAQNIKNSLEMIGINVNIIKASDNQYQNYLKSKKYDMILTGIYIPYSPDLSTYFEDGNLANYYNEEIRKIIKEVKDIQDEKILKEKYNRLIKIYKDELPYIFLYYNRGTLIYNPNIVGNINPTAYNIYNNIETWYKQ